MRKSLNCILSLVFSTILFLPMTSCVGKKKFLSEVSKRTTCDSTLQVINKHNMTLNREMANLNLQLAERSGEVKALQGIHDKQVKQIDHLESEIRKMGTQSLNQQQTLDGALQLKEQELAHTKDIINSFKDAIQQQEEQLNQLIGKVANHLNSFSNEDLSVEVKDGLGYIRLSEKLMYRKGSAKMSNSAYDILESISTVLLEYPQMDLVVIGHTDNQPVKNSDSWDISVLRATPIVRMLTKEFGLNPNQVTAGGKGDSKPFSSNDTTTGREQNRRTEIVIYPPSDKILKMVQDSDQ